MAANKQTQPALFPTLSDVALVNLENLEGVDGNCSLQDISRAIAEASARSRKPHRANQLFAGEPGGFVIANFAKADETAEHRWIGPFPPAIYGWAKEVARAEGMDQLLWKPEGAGHEQFVHIAAVPVEVSHWGNFEHAIRTAEERRALFNATGTSEIPKRDTPRI